MADVPHIGIWDFLFQRKNLPFPDNHVIFQSAATNKAYTYNDIKRQAENFGGAIQRWEWSKGDVLMVMSPNSIEVPHVVWGCHFAGGVVAPVNPDLTADELRYQLIRSRTKALVAHTKCLKTALKGSESVLSSDHVLALEDNEHGVTTIAEFAKNALLTPKTLPPPPAISADDLAYLVYSSGTTGLPKGVMISHGNVLAATLLQARLEAPHALWETDRSLAVLPIYHIYGLICLMHLPLWLGISTVFMEKFQLETFCDSVQRYDITHAYVAPPIVLHLAKNSIVEKYDLRSLKMITSGGAPLAAALINELYNRRKLPVRQAYGLSETTSVSHIQRRTDWQSSIGSNGPPLPGLEAKFIREDGTVAAIKEEGELWIRGPTVFRGYRDEPDMSAACLTPDGWFKSGDIGYEDAHGNLYITDRSKDMIKYKGYQIAPAELENLLLHHPSVQDAAVISVVNQDLQSEVPLAYVTLKEGYPKSMETASNILDYVKNRVIHYKHLRGGLIWTPSIPKSSSGKILKRTLRDRVSTVDKGRAIGAINYVNYRTTKL
jgi:acyl-CoA synthetase (AMP-forming)/AMP-acid ligase II